MQANDSYSSVGFGWKQSHFMNSRDIMCSIDKKWAKTQYLFERFDYIFRVYVLTFAQCPLFLSLGIQADKEKVSKLTVRLKVKLIYCAKVPLSLSVLHRRCHQTQSQEGVWHAQSVSMFQDQVQYSWAGVHKRHPPQLCKASRIAEVWRLE